MSMSEIRENFLYRICRNSELHEHASKMAKWEIAVQFDGTNSNFQLLNTQHFNDIVRTEHFITRRAQQDMTTTSL